MSHQIQKKCPIDWTDLFERIGDEGIIVQFSESFVSGSEKIITSLKDAVDSKDPDNIELYGHALKGSASNIGAISLAKLAFQLEKAASEKNVESAPEWMDNIKAEFDALVDFLKLPDWVSLAKKADADSSEEVSS